MPFDGPLLTEPCAPEREPGCIRAVILYSPFDPNDRTIADIAWQPGKTVTQYLEGLPEDVDWTVSAAGRVLEREEWDHTTLIEDDTIILAVTPHKGGQAGFMIAAMIILTVVTAGVGAAIAGGALAAGGALGGLGLAGATGLSFAAGSTSAMIAAGVASSAISIGGNLLLNAVFPASAAKIDNRYSDEGSSPSYSLDGPQATARENSPMPVVYGEFRTGGNRINVFTETSGDGKTQDVYLQYAVSDGEVESISDLQINDQPASNFRDVTWDWRPGTLGQPQLGWFIDIPISYADGRTLSQTPIIYNTVDEVDRVALDVSFPTGLFNIDDKKGDRYNRQASLFAVLDPIGGGNPILMRASRWDDSWINAGNVDIPGVAIRVTVAVQGANGTSPFTPYNANCVINQVLPSGPYTAVNETRTGQVANSYVADNNWAAGQELLVFEFNDQNSINSAMEYPFQVYVSGGWIHSIEVLRKSEFIINRNERNAFTVTLDSGAIPRGRYRLNVWRGEPEYMGDKGADKMVLAQVKEIQADPVRYNRTAFYALRVRLNEQLSSLPRTSVLVRGRKVNIYDANGNVITRQWSNNPADVTLDILLSQDGFRQMPKSRIDFPWFSRWRSFCAANNLSFNGVFDYQSNAWDAAVQVMRVGRATPIVSGLKWSGVIEKPEVPVMMFGTQNIVKGSFRNNWIGKTGRANSIEGQYYNAENGFRQMSVFATDEAALARGDDLVQATINLIGVTSPTQAQAEVDLQLQINRLITQGCSFAANMDAIGCTVGDIIYVQHDMPKWGWADRIVSTGAGTLTIHNPLAPQGEGAGGLLPEGDWRVLVLKPAVLRHTATLSQISGPRITVTDPPAGNVRVTRVTINAKDYRVLDRVDFGSSTTFILDRTPPASVGASVLCYETDAMLEGSLARPAEFATTLSVTSWTHSVPIEPGDQVLIGRVGKFKKQFRVNKFSYDSDQTRTIECLEYIPEVYDPVGTTPDTDYSELSPFPMHVGDLTADQLTTDVDGGGVRYYAQASWTAPLNDPRGHRGAYVYVSVNTGDFNLHEQVPLGRTTSTFEANLNDTIRFKVIAYDANGIMAPVLSAPIAAVTIGRRLRAPSLPTNLSVVGGIRMMSISWTRADDPDIKFYEIFENSTADLGSAYKVGESATTAFARNNLPPRVTRHYWVRSVSYANEISVGFLGPMAGTTDWLIASDIADGILTTAKFASSISPIGTPLTASELSTFKTVDSIIFPQVTLTDPVTLQVLNAQQLYRWNGTQWVGVVSAPELTGQLTDAQIASLSTTKLSGTLNETLFPTNLRPVEVVGTLPNTGNFAGRMVYLTTDGKLYRHTGSPSGAAGFTAGIPAGDLLGAISSTQITDGAITTPKIAANAVTANTIQAGAITSDKIAANAVTAGSIQAGAITADKIVADAIGASKLVVGDTQNSYPDFDMLDAAFYASSNNTPYSFVTTATGSLGQRFLDITASGLAGVVESEWFTVDVDADYAISGAAFLSGTTGNVVATLELQLGTLAATGAVTATRTVQVGTRTGSTLADRFTVNVTTTATERRARFVMRKGSTTGASARFGGFIVRRRYNGSLIVDGSISAAKIAAGAVTTEKLSVGSASANLIYNSCMAYNRSGWAVGGTVAATGWGVVGTDLADNTWRLTGAGTGGVWRSGTVAANNYIDMYWQHYNTQRIPVVPGEWYEWQALVQAHRCSLEMKVSFYNAAGSYLSETLVATTTPISYANGQVASNYLLRWGKVQAPANAATALPFFRMIGQSGFGSATGTDPYIFFTRCLFARAFANQTEPTPWGPGGVTEIEGGMIKAASIQADNIAANAITSDKIAANSIVAGKIAAGAISSTEIAAGQIKAVNLASETLITQAGQIGSAVITEAKIGDLEVGTLKIKNNAITATSAGWGGAGPYNPITNTGDARADVVNGDSNFAALYIIEAVFYCRAYQWLEFTGEGTTARSEPVPLSLRRNGQLITVISSATTTLHSFTIKTLEYLGPGFYTWTASPNWGFFNYQTTDGVLLTVTKLLK